ncbi:TetR/AcrR family transcriptional regulator [Erysipelothrix urinaevulpis]|uniref:TetR/AcrR family transcriptional regulator n=1 Tax=Erysipelothrix urinaevulpis TaxID=2683717 RepID=UPI001356A3C6|nr:TetR/AcrR family transcriptional regulator [Erysipelothrix urinaevulpis]
MAKTIKGKRSKEMIIDSACQVLADESYDSLSLNQFCEDNKISKGQFYHHFQSKDALYLETVNYVYSLFYLNLKENVVLGNGFESDLKNYLDTRKNFSIHYPVYSSVFFKSIITPPEHLRVEINQLHHNIKELNENILKEIVRHAPLREGLSKNQVINYYLLVLDTFNHNFMFTNKESLTEYLDLFDILIDTLLYGTIERGI